MTTIPLRFQIGARTLATIPRQLHRIGLSLDQALARTPPHLPPLDLRDHGYLVTSLPADTRLDAPGLLTIVRQRYTRHHLDLTGGRTGLSSNARAQLRRKHRKLVERGATIRAYRDADAIAAFHPLGRQVAALTYQERLLGAALPLDPAPLVALAAADRVRGWLLLVDEAPVAFLCCTADGNTLRYDHVGHDPAWSGWSPGAVLQAAALDQLFADRFARFDFTEGDGQHKRQFATAGIPCVDLLLLRPTPTNRATAVALTAFDRLVARAKQTRLRTWAARLRR